MMSSYKLHNYKEGDTLVCYRPATPELTAEGLLKDLSVIGSYTYRWNTDCLSLNMENGSITIKYHTWHHYDKYEEGLEKMFTICIKNDILIEFDEIKINIPLEWLHTTVENDIPPMPEVLKPIVYTDFAYAIMDLGKNIYSALCKIYLNKHKLNL
jgi:hypothetical protein